MKFKAVIFDLDGTLINSLEDIADSMNTVLKTNKYPYP
jgi:phosphoglycolate phosphatase